MKRKLLRTKIVGVVALAVVAVLSWLLLLGPATAKPARIAEETAAADAERASTLNRISTLNEDVARLPDTQARLDAINNRFPSTIDPALTEDKIAAAAAAAGLPPDAITNVTPDEAVPYQDPSEVAADPAATTPPAGPAATTPPAGATPPSGDTSVLQQQVGIQVVGGLPQIGAFADILEEQYGFAVRNLTVAPNEKNRSQYQASLSTFMFLLPPMPEPPGQDIIDALNAQQGSEGVATP